MLLPRPRIRGLLPTGPTLPTRHDSYGLQPSHARTDSLWRIDHVLFGRSVDSVHPNYLYGSDLLEAIKEESAGEGGDGDAVGEADVLWV